MHQQQSRRRLVLRWTAGLAALATVVLVVGASVWFALSGTSDDGSGSAEPVPGASTPARESTPESVPTPTATAGRESVEQREDRGAELAAEAGDAGRAGDEATADSAAGPEGATDADLAAARGWLTTALAWSENDAALGPWGRAVERANTQWAHPDVQVTVVPSTALEAIAADATVHGALPRAVEIVDETKPEWAGPGEVTLRADVVFGTGDGWTRPGLRLVVDLQVTGGVVKAVFVDDGYVISDPELLP
jgi:hypothetical protein